MAMLYKYTAIILLIFWSFLCSAAWVEVWSYNTNSHSGDFSVAGISGTIKFVRTSPVPSWFSIYHLNGVDLYFESPGPNSENIVTITEDGFHVNASGGFEFHVIAYQDDGLDPGGPIDPPVPEDPTDPEIVDLDWDNDYTGREDGDGIDSDDDVPTLNQIKGILLEFKHEQYNINNTINNNVEQLRFKNYEQLAEVIRLLKIGNNNTGTDNNSPDVNNPSDPNLSAITFDTAILPELEPHSSDPGDGVIENAVLNHAVVNDLEAKIIDRKSVV